MKKLITLTLLLLMITPCLLAQKKELSQARSYIKSGRNLDKAEELMKGLLQNDPANKLNTRIYLLWYQAVLKQYENGNEQLYLKQKYDTASMYSQTKRMFEILMALDSVDVLPNKKGKVNPKFRKKHSEELDVFRPNLYYGGSFYLRKNKYDAAFSFYDLYINTATHPMFEKFSYLDKDSLVLSAAYLSVYSGYMLGDPVKTLKHSSMALTDTIRNKYVLQYIAESYQKLGNYKQYLNVLEEGFSKYPTYWYFFPHLSDYYISNGKQNKVLQLANDGLSASPNNQLFLFTKSSVLLNLERNDECIITCDSLISINDTMPEPYYFAGMAYMNMVKNIEEKQDARNHKKEIQNYLSNALPYFEKYRKLKPNEKKKWGIPLYKIYLNMNMGKQFEEIDKLLNSI